MTNVQDIFNIILQNNECRKYSIYYDKIYTSLIELDNDIKLLERHHGNTNVYNILKTIILMKIKDLLQSVMNSKNEVVYTIDMILSFNKTIQYDTMNLSERSVYKEVFPTVLTKENTNYIDINNIALHLEYLDIKLLELFQKFLVYIKRCITMNLSVQSIDKELFSGTLV